MKKVSIVLAVILCFGLTNAQEAKDVAIKNLTEGIITFSDGELSAYNPISSVNKAAVKQAAKTIVLTKENIAESLVEAKKYKACIITVASHTVAKITDFNKTIMSGSWGCKLPFADGYIQKATLISKQDYVNNIIGIPDSQRRTMFLFN